MFVGQAQQLLLQTGGLVAALDPESPSGRQTTSHGKSLAVRGDPARRLTSARQATLAVAGSQTGSRDGYIEQERLFCKIVWGDSTAPWGEPLVRSSKLPSCRCTGAFSQRSMYGRTHGVLSWCRTAFMTRS